MRGPRQRLNPMSCIAMLAVLALAACGSSGSSSGSNTTAPKATTTGSGGSPTTVGATVTSSTSAPPSSSTAGGSTSATLVLPLCGILDSATVVRIVGAGTGSCQNFSAESEAGRCLWGTLGPNASSVQLTAFTGSKLASRKVGWRLAFRSVPGVGLGAWAGAPITIGSVKNVVLYVDYGTFGLELAVSAPSADVTMAAALARAVK